MKKYVFITQSISGITGNQRYVNNKTHLLRKNGWEVIVLWNYNISPVVLEHVKCFENQKYIHHELKFYPSWYTEKQRNKIIARLVAVIGVAEQIVIESNKLELSPWGELLANRLRCKHVTFVTTEGLTIRNKNTFDFCYAKLLKDEFFNINSASVTRFFSNFIRIEDPENHYWGGFAPSIEVDYYSFPAFDELPEANYTITHFGRYKRYIPNFISELNSFTSKHPDMKFNLFLIGDLQLQECVLQSLNQTNVNVSFHQEVNVIPKQIFEKSDIVFAAAGCASLASEYMPNVISMDVKTCEPLGLLKRTTWDTNAASGQYPNDKSISQWLESLLIKKDFYPLLKTQYVSHDYDYQMQFIDKCDYNYIDSTKVREPITRHDDLCSVLIKMGLFHIVEYFYFNKRGIRIIWR